MFALRCARVAVAEPSFLAQFAFLRNNQQLYSCSVLDQGLPKGGHYSTRTVNFGSLLFNSSVPRREKKKKKCTVLVSRTINRQTNERQPSTGFTQVEGTTVCLSLCLRMLRVKTRNEGGVGCVYVVWERGMGGSARGRA